MPEDLDTDASDTSEVPGYYEIPISGANNKGNTLKTPECVTAIYLDVANTKKKDKNTRRIIYKAIDAPYFGEVKIFP